MNFGELYRDALPDWTRLRMLDDSEVEATAELLVALTQLGSKPGGEDNYESLVDAWLEVLCGYDPTSRAALAAHVHTSYGRTESLFDHPHAFGILLASACRRLRSPIAQFHVLCLLIVTVFCSGPDERQVEMCYRIGKKFGMVDERVEELFARMWAASWQRLDELLASKLFTRMWTAYHAASAQSRGLSFDPEYVRGTHWGRRAALFRSTNPFEMPPQ